jgi:hypothetical protein
MGSIKPLVLIIDLDGTIIGDIFPQIARYEIFDVIQKPTSHQIPLLLNELEKGLIRPYFKTFIDEMKNNYNQNLEIFIYTASEKKWGTFIIQVVEKYIGFKFNRPIFTRDHCILMNTTKLKWTKSIAKISPIIFRKIKHKYPLLSMTDLNEQIMFIDNNKTIKDEHEKYKLLKCPSYNCFQPCDILNGITINDKTLGTISQILLKYNFISRFFVDINQLYADYYAHLSILYNEVYVYKEKKNDEFWKQMEEIFKMHHFKTFSRTNIEFIRQKLQQHKPI